MVILDQGRVEQITLYLNEEEGFSSYEGLLPENLVANMKLGDVLSLLGAPSKKSDRNLNEYLGRFSVWLRYNQRRHNLHVEFNQSDDGIKHIYMIEEA
ncbi:hypothetical protein [Xanthomonas translucens]|nr:hypothetical protein [Xanthomonas translucens]QEO28140.1 hypothetical protein F0H32_19985 [Xanthomonas translucens pv. undulosa]WLA08564.1 hypothetical protein MO328_20025 [Xanthomonas translucens]